MTIYILTYLILLLLWMLLKNQNKRKKIICIIMAVVWTVIIGLRHPTMGHDLRYGYSNGYWGMYQVIGESSWKEALYEQFLNYERGYVIFNKILYSVSQDGQLLLFVCAGIGMAAIMWLIYKYSKSPLLSIIVFLALPVFLINFSGLRQGVAIAITIYSFRYIKEKKLIPFVIAVLIANTFHSSAIIFLAAYPIYYIKTQRNILKVGSVLILPLVYVFRTPLFNMLAGLLGENDTALPTNAFMLFLFFTMIYIFCLLFEDKENREQRGCRNLFYTACICQVFGSVSNLAMRVGYYFMVYLVLLFPEIIAPKVNWKIEIKGDRIDRTAYNNSVIMYIAVFAFFLCWGIYSISTATWAKTNPYSFFWK